MEYHQLERAVFDFLCEYRESHPGFTFSMRKQGTNGIFIGTEHSDYFGFTLWDIGTAPSPASVDLLAFYVSQTQRARTQVDLTFQLARPVTNGSQDQINEAFGFELIEALRQAFADILEVRDHDKRLWFRLKLTHSATTEEEILNALQQGITQVAMIVDNVLQSVRERNPSWHAQRITEKQFIRMLPKALQQKPERVVQETRCYWGFHANPSIWRISDEVRAHSSGHFTINLNHRERVKEGDLGVLWQAGQSAHIIAIVRIAGNPSKGRLLQQRIDEYASDPKHFESSEWLVPIDYLLVLEPDLITRELIKQDPILSEVQGFRNAQGKKTFEINHQQFMRLTNMSGFQDYFESKSDHDAVDANRHPLNQILYGPPGTGKTYRTTTLAASIVSGRAVEDRAEAQRIFKDSLGDQIEFVTFHQSFSYEDFIQGLRPMPGETGISFDYVDGIFKKIADRALENYRSARGDNRPPFEKVWQTFVQLAFDAESERVELKLANGQSFYLTDITGPSLPMAKADGSPYKNRLSLSTVKNNYLSNQMTIGALQSYYQPLLDKLNDVAGDLPSEEQVDKVKNYVIVIDEINRGNISKIFGELITLLEEDKRYDQPNEIRTTLTSGEEFVVPPNLYIIGTMNTADKSIALVDIALRRRFSFVPLYPQYQLDGVSIAHADMLKKLNEAVCRDKGTDFQIGHSYFIDNGSFDLAEVMNSKVIPLLYEYFMNDGDAVDRVLRAAGITCEKSDFTGLLTYGG